MILGTHPYSGAIPVPRLVTLVFDFPRSGVILMIPPFTLVVIPVMTPADFHTCVLLSLKKFILVVRVGKVFFDRFSPSLNALFHLLFLFSYLFRFRDESQSQRA